MQIAARTGDPARDLDEEACRAAHARLLASGVPAGALVRLIEIHAPSALDTLRAYGESLPEGLRLVESPLGADGLHPAAQEARDASPLTTS